MQSAPETISWFIILYYFSRSTILLSQVYVKYNITALKSMTQRFNFVFMPIILSFFIFTYLSSKSRLSLSGRADQLELGAFVYNVLDMAGHAAPSIRSLYATQTTYYTKPSFIYIFANFQYINSTTIIRNNDYYCFIKSK